MAHVKAGTIKEINGKWRSATTPRQRRWLWMSLNFFGGLISEKNNPKPIHPSSAKAVVGGDIENELNLLLSRYLVRIEARKIEGYFVQESEFDWLEEKNTRQLLWVTKQVHTWVGYEIPDALAKLGYRDYLITLLDLVPHPVAAKHDYLSQLHLQWRQHLKNSNYLNWFSTKEEKSRCDLAWGTLERRLRDPVFAGSTSFSAFNTDHYRKHGNCVGLKCFIDSLALSHLEKKSHVDHIKRLWSQQLYREKQTKDKVRQRNFSLADKTYDDLGLLAKKLNTDRTKALGLAIAFALENDISAIAKV